MLKLTGIVFRGRAGVGGGSEKEGYDISNDFGFIGEYKVVDSDGSFGTEGVTLVRQNWNVGRDNLSLKRLLVAMKS